METFSALLAICAGNSPVPGEFPTQRPVTRSFDIYFDLRSNKRLSKQSWGWWFETLSCSLWRHRNVVLGHSLVVSGQKLNWRGNAMYSIHSDVSGLADDLSGWTIISNSSDWQLTLGQSCKDRVRLVIFVYVGSKRKPIIVKPLI